MSPLSKAKKRLIFCFWTVNSLEIYVWDLLLQYSTINDESSTIIFASVVTDLERTFFGSRIGLFIEKWGILFFIFLSMIYL